MAEGSSGCTKDTDCKNERICESSVCVDAPDKAGLGGQAAPEADPDEHPRGWRRGGPAGDRPTAGRGPATTPKLEWDVDVGAVIFARPTIVGDDKGRSIAYVGSHAGRFVGVVTDGAEQGKVTMDLSLGGMVWATAASDGRGRLYVGADDDHLYAIDHTKGTVVWKTKLGSCSPSRAPGPEGARCDADGGPTIGPDGDLYIGADGVYRVSRDGVIRWHYPEGKAKAKHVFSSPLVTKEGLVVFGGQDGFVTAINTDGTEAWRYKVRADVDGSPAVGIDGTIYIGADDGRLYALRTDGSLKWSFVSQGDIRSSVAVDNDGTLFATSFDGNLYSLDPKGNVRWVLPTGARIAASPILDAASVVYVGSQDDRLYAVTTDGKVRWNVELPGDIDSSVAISDAGTLVFGADDGRLRGLR